MLYPPQFHYMHLLYFKLPVRTKKNTSTLVMFSKFGRLISKLNTLKSYICCGDKCFKAELLKQIAEFS